MKNEVTPFSTHPDSMLEGLDLKRQHAIWSMPFLFSHSTVVAPKGDQNVCSPESRPNEHVTQ
jgi:hypothetical protein